MATKKVKRIVKLQIQAGQATPAPPVGSTLGPTGINIQEFCKKFNALTQKQSGWLIPVVITIYEDRSFSFITKTPPAAEMIKNFTKIEKGSSEPNKDKVGKITKEKLSEIARTKMPDLNVYDLESAIKIIEGTARSMGVEVID
ncbi:MAG: 50S ribosomal protein L11 [candidate division Zixibacteria bacterium 4484_93]|nr:MAG: 50S ribosomal protein L11 [candidate division Zixibacteria bacterium 4484_93]RKZ33613.1 MAG: 50S ribosomal protein L11 [bacterium]